MNEIKNWEPSQTGGIRIGLQEAARLLGYSDTYVRRMHLKWGLMPANERVIGKKKQHLLFYIDDVLALKNNPDAFDISGQDGAEKKAANAA